MARLLETMRVNAIQRLSVTASWSGTSARSESASAIYNPPPGWVILQTEVQVHSSNNGSREVSTIGGGLNLVTETVLSEAFSAATEAAASYEDTSVQGKIEERGNQARSELRKYSANMNTIQATVRARAHGSVFDRKRGWEDISVVADLIYLGEPDLNSVVAAIEMEFGIDVPNLGIELPAAA